MTSQSLLSTELATSKLYRRCRFPLLNLTFPVVFQLPESPLVLMSLSLSHDELRVSCPAAELPLIVPRVTHHQPGHKVVHRVRLELDTAYQPEAEVQLQFSRRYSQTQFQIGLRLVQMEPAAQEQIEIYLTQALQQNAALTDCFS